MPRSARVAPGGMVFHVLNRGVGRMRLFDKEGDYEAFEYFYHVTRYVERNALRAGLVSSAEQWRWSSLWRRLHGSSEQVAFLSRWPLPQPRNWESLVNQPQSEGEIEAIRRCIRRGQPYGCQPWVERTASQLGLESTLRAPHRPRKPPR